MQFSIAAILSIAAATAAIALPTEAIHKARDTCITILDPSFESASSLSGYPYIFFPGNAADTAVIATGGAHTGNSYLNATAGAAGSDLYFCQSVQFCANGAYTLSAYAKKSGTGSAYISFESSSTIWPAKSLTNTWAPYSQQITWTRGAVWGAICIDFSMTSAGQSIAIDDFAIVAN